MLEHDDTLLRSDRDELTLDPVGAEWDDFRALAHRMVDDMLDHLSSLHEQPAWKEMPPHVRSSFHEPVPTRGEGAEAAYAEFRERVLPYPNGNLHPRFFGWVQGSGTPLGMMADMLASGLNPHLAGLNQAPALVEHQVIAWLAELMGFPRGSSGLFVTGGTMANIIGLAVARFAAVRAAGHDVRENGLYGLPRLVFYGSRETHGWARKGAELLGLGNVAFRQIAVDAGHRIDLDALARAVDADRQSGLLPICVVGTAGTVNIGATDDLRALGDYCREQKLWFHVDGAFGALVHLSPSLRHIVAGMESADSLAFDLHKWGSLPFECACVLVRDAETHRAAFATTATYLAATSRGVIAGGLPFADRGVELTRSFKALKVWLAFKAHGTDHLARLIEQNVEQTRYLTSLVAANRDLEILAPVPLNIVCFRWAPPSVPAERLDAINEEILVRLQEQGIAIPSGTIVDGRYAIRAANVNHRTRREDLHALVDGVVRLGPEVVASLGA